MVHDGKVTMRKNCGDLACRTAGRLPPERQEAIAAETQKIARTTQDGTTRGGASPVKAITVPRGLMSGTIPPELPKASRRDRLTDMIHEQVQVQQAAESTPIHILPLRQPSNVVIIRIPAPIHGFDGIQSEPRRHMCSKPTNDQKSFWSSWQCNSFQVQMRATAYCGSSRETARRRGSCSFSRYWAFGCPSHRCRGFRHEWPPQQAKTLPAPP
mmetsp:Transcript_68748/g.201322  ORF Transcript_68748/g.201322 Transcript_68748/m.201322 type:complete len:213 (-) Transcript_68748:98-736(-)